MRSFLEEKTMNHLQREYTFAFALRMRVLKFKIKKELNQMKMLMGFKFL